MAVQEDAALGDTEIETLIMRLKYTNRVSPAYLNFRASSRIFLSSGQDVLLLTPSKHYAKTWMSNDAVLTIRAKNSTAKLLCHLVW